MATAITVLGILSAAAAHIAYETYYSTLGASVDELGISTTRMLGLSSLVVLAVATSGAIIFGFLRLVTRPGRQPFLAGCLLIGFGVATYVTPAYPLVLGTAVLGLALPASLAWPHLAPSSVRDSLRTAVVAQSVLALALAGTVIVGASDAARIEAGGEDARGFAAHLAATVLYTPMHDVCVQMQSGGGGTQRSLLGIANGVAVLYDAAQSRVTRLPIAEIAAMPARAADERC